MKRLTIIALVAGTVLITAAVSLVATRDDATPTPGGSSMAPSPTAGTTPPSAEPTGQIEGPLTYPAETIPADLRVCARNLATQAETCSAERLTDGRFKHGQGFRLAVPPGDYHVYAMVPSLNGDYRAFYSRFVTCGYLSTCGDHTPITVTVAAGQAVTGIEPGDFYH